MIWWICFSRIARSAASCAKPHSERQVERSECEEFSRSDLRHLQEPQQFAQFGFQFSRFTWDRMEHKIR
jgi:hypothetical protein